MKNILFLPFAILIVFSACTKKDTGKKSRVVLADPVLFKVVNDSFVIDSDSMELYWYENNVQCTLNGITPNAILDEPLFRVYYPVTGIDSFTQGNIVDSTKPLLFCGGIVDVMGQRNVNSIFIKLKAGVETKVDMVINKIIVKDGLNRDDGIQYELGSISTNGNALRIDSSYFSQYMHYPVYELPF